MTRATLLIAITLAGATTGSAGHAQGYGTAQTPSRAELIATMLVDAHRQAETPSRSNRRALGSALTTLDRLGVHAQPGIGDDAIAEWRALPGVRAGNRYRGRVLGPAFRRGWLDAGQMVQVEQLFLSGQAASVSVANLPDGPLRLGVSGPDGRANCQEAARNCNWMPSFTQRYTITIRNIGPRATRFYLVMD